MSKKTFNPSEWRNPINSESPISPKSSKSSISPNAKFNLTEEVEELTKAIESAGIDITSGYKNWLKLGFALADGLGEDGRQYFHRLSRFYPSYNASEADEQYTKCIKGKRNDVTYHTLFFLAKEYGITIDKHNNNNTDIQDEVFKEMENMGDMEDMEDVVQPLETMPTFSQEVFDLLPSLLQDVVNKAENDDDADLLLLGSLVCLSACLPNVSGLYASRIYSPNLFLIVTAPASSGKGRLTLCKNLVMPIHKSLKKQYEDEMKEYNRLQSEYELDKKGRTPPQKPIRKMLFIPGNSSATAIYQVLDENNGTGIIFETEGDVLVESFKSDYGNYSAGLRQAFQHESISYNRRANNECVEIEQPHLSAVISGTPLQIITLIKNAENGLFSRHMFYCLNFRLEWIDVFAEVKQPLDEYFEELGQRFFLLYEKLKQSQPISFSVSPEQGQQFNAYFSKVLIQYYYMYGISIVASVRRMGVIAFRIAMILTMLRFIDDTTIPTNIVCSDTDFRTALIMAKVLLQHTLKVFCDFPSTDSKPFQKPLTVICQRFLDNLPIEFNRQTYNAVAASLKIPTKTADKHIQKFCSLGLLQHFEHDKYVKP